MSKLPELRVKEELAELIYTLQSLDKSDFSSLTKISSQLVECLRSGNTIFWVGNGGSAAQSMHISAEFIGRLQRDRDPFKSVALCTDQAALTCIANDYEYSNVFARQVFGLGNAGDVLVLFSTSGNSQNLIKAVSAAKEKEMKTIAFLGKGGGELSQLCDMCVIVPSSSTQRIQETHLLLGHILCGTVEDEIRAINANK